MKLGRENENMGKTYEMQDYGTQPERQPALMEGKSQPLSLID